MVAVANMVAVAYSVGAVAVAYCVGVLVVAVQSGRDGGGLGRCESSGVVEAQTSWDGRNRGRLL